MKRKNLEFSAGLSSIIFNLETEEIMSYELHSEAIHELYGGKQYYSSRSGMSGAGWIEGRPNLITLL